MRSLPFSPFRVSAGSPALPLDVAVRHRPQVVVAVAAVGHVDPALGEDDVALRPTVLRVVALAATHEVVAVAAVGGVVAVARADDVERRPAR